MMYGIYDFPRKEKKKMSKIKKCQISHNSEQIEFRP